MALSRFGVGKLMVEGVSAGHFGLMKLHRLAT